MGNAGPSCRGKGGFPNRNACIPSHGYPGDRDKDGDFHQQGKSERVNIKCKALAYDDSREVIKRLRESYQVAVISNMYEITAQRIRGLFPDFFDLFDVVTLSCEAGLVKPDPRIFTHTLDKLNQLYGSDIQPSEVMMIGDLQEKDVDPPLALGMQARLIDRTTQNLNDILNGNIK